MTKTNIAVKSSKYFGIAVLAAICMAAWIGKSSGQQRPASVSVKADEIGGVVSSTKGPEAGVWAIAETTDLPTRYIKEVVTDDRGRYLIPALPKANYTVWARGYGLVDSPKVQTAPGTVSYTHLTLPTIYSV